MSAMYTVKSDWISDVGVLIKNYIIEDFQFSTNLKFIYNKTKTKRGD